MRPKVLIATAVLAAFLGGTLFASYLKPRLANAFVAPAAQTQTIAPHRVRYQPAVYREAQPLRHHRSWEREVLIVAGSSGAGAAIGAAAHGARGAAVGAIAGGVAGLVYDLATRNH